MQARPGVRERPDGPIGPIEQLQMQAVDMAQQLAGLKAQRQVMERQLRIGNLEAGSRSQLIMKKANVDIQIGQLEADLAGVRAQLASRQGVPIDRVGSAGQIIQLPPQRQRPDVDPEMVIGMSFALLMVIAVPMSIAFARRIWRGKPVPVAPRADEIAPRLDRLEQAVDAIAIEIERISEGQRFVTRIMAERPVPQPAAGTKAAQSPESPILALGAGPAEPIRMPERQGVRPSTSNTPH